MKNALIFSRTVSDVSHSALTAIGDEIVLDSLCGDLQIEVLNGHASVALQDFELQVKVHPNGDYCKTITGTGWASIANILTYKSGSLNSLAGATRHMARVSLGPCYSIKFLAQSASSSTGRAVTVLGAVELK